MSLPRAYATTFTCAAQNLTGYASNVTGATFTLSATTANDGMAHPLIVTNDSANNHSGKTLAVTGTANGVVITETMAAPAGSTTSTSVNYYETVTSVVPSATIGADTFDLGWTAKAQTPWQSVDERQAAFSVGCSAVVTGTINYDLQSTMADVSTATVLQAVPTGVNHATMTNKTTSYADGYLFPIRAVRLNVNSHTSGVATLFIMQGMTD